MSANLFSGDQGSASKPAVSTSRPSPAPNTENKPGRFSFTTRSTLPAKMTPSSDGKTGTSSLRKGPLSFQQTPPISSRLNLSPRGAEGEKPFADADSVTAWQSDMQSIEEAQSQIQTDQMNLLHSQIHILTRELGDLQKHVVAMDQKMEINLAEHAQAHGASLANLEAKLQSDLQSVADSHSEKLQSLNDEHNEKHAQNSEALESSLQNVLESTHSKLQNELQELRHGGAGSLKDMGKILADVTEEVDKINQAVEQEHELRMAVEEKLDKMCAELRAELQLSLEESHAALKLELAELSGNSENIKTAMQQAHAALTDEFEAHKAATEERHSSLQDAMNNMNEEHHERHAQNAQKLEDGIENVLGGAHAKLQEEIGMLKSGRVASIQDLQKIVADVTQQVDDLDQASQKEHELRMAVEAKLDKMFNEQDIVIANLSKDMKVALDESHAALKLELAEHGQNAEEIKAAMADANAALKEETKLAHGSLKNELQSLSKNTEAKHREIADELTKVHEEHTERHAQNAERLEAGLETVLGNTHARLQDEMKLLKGGGVGSLKDLQTILADVTQQVDNLDQALSQEHELRMNIEAKLDQMFSDQDKALSDLKKDMKVSLHESHAALKLELAEHGKNTADIKAAMDDAHAALQEETKLAHGSLKNELSSLSKNNDALHKKTQDELRKELKAVHEVHEERHAANAEKLEAGLDNVLGSAHSKLQEEMRILKAGGAGSLKDLQKILMDVTQQVDNLDQALQQEHQLRMNVETRLDQMFGDQDKVINDLKKDLKVSLNESHAALKLEMAEHGKNSNAIKAAMEDAQAALQGETRLAHGSLKNELASLSRGSDGKHKQTMEQLNNNLQAVHAEHCEKHAQIAERLEAGLQNLKVAHYETQQSLKQERAARELQDKTFLDFINDVRIQKEAQEATMQEQLRLERVSREVQANQLRDALSHQHSYAPNPEYTDLLMQERGSRESANMAMERRIEAFERSMAMERHERTAEMQRLWDVFDGHTHEALSSVPPNPVPQVTRQLSTIQPIRTSLVPAQAVAVSPTYVETVRPHVETVRPHVETVNGIPGTAQLRSSSVETLTAVPGMTPALTTRQVMERSPLTQTRNIVFPTTTIAATTTTGGGSVNLPPFSH